MIEVLNVIGIEGEQLKVLATDQLVAGSIYAFHNGVWYLNLATLTAARIQGIDKGSFKVTERRTVIMFIK